MMRYTNNRIQDGASRLFNVQANRPIALLKQCPAYASTGMENYPELAHPLGLEKLFIKNEATRMRLGSFKALGGAFAIAQMVVDAAGTTDLESAAAKNAAKDLTFVTASAGNHGLSVAAGARVFGAHAVILLSSSVPEGFANRIRSLDADVVRVDGSYEDSVAAAIDLAEKNGWKLLADGSWPGYIERPALVMEGYTVLAEECRADFQEMGVWPNQVVLQAGVGGLAAAVAAHIREIWPHQPHITIVEPDAAPCLLESVKAQQITSVGGPESNMGRLDCKDASLIAFEALRRDADLFLTITDEEATNASNRLAEAGIETTPSGAAAFAGLSKLQLTSSDKCLVIVTEGPEQG